MKCTIVGCRSNYVPTKKENKAKKSCTKVFRGPRNVDELQRWTRSLPFKKFICILIWTRLTGDFHKIPSLRTDPRKFPSQAWGFGHLSMVGMSLGGHRTTVRGLRWREWIPRALGSWAERCIYLHAEYPWMGGLRLLAFAYFLFPLEVNKLLTAIWDTRKGKPRLRVDSTNLLYDFVHLLKIFRNLW